MAEVQTQEVPAGSEHDPAEQLHALLGYFRAQEAVSRLVVYRLNDAGEHVAEAIAQAQLDAWSLAAARTQRAVKAVGR